MLLLPVDYVLITGDDQEGIWSLKNSLSSQFDLTDLGPLCYFMPFSEMPSNGSLLSSGLPSFTSEVSLRHSS